MHNGYVARPKWSKTWNIFGVFGKRDLLSVFPL